jgi:hypothetical protein
VTLTFIARRDGEITLLEFFLHVCLRAIVGSHDADTSDLEPRINQLHRAALATLHQILLSPHSLAFSDMELEHLLIDRLTKSLDDSDPFIQVLLLDVVFDALKIRNAARASFAPPASPTIEARRPMTQETPQSTTLSTTTERGDQLPIDPPPPPMSLIKCLQAGFASRSSLPVLDSPRRSFRF